MKILLITLAYCLLLTGLINAQGVSINSTGATAHNSALLDVSGTDGGLLIPRMLSTERASIVSPAEGLLIYQTDSPEGFYYYNGTNWIQLGAGGSGSSGDDGEMYEYKASGNPSSISITTAGTFYGWTTASAGVANGVTFNDNTNADRLTISSAGDYQVSVSVSFGTSTNNTIVEGAVHKNGTKINTLTFRRKLSSGDLGVAMITGLITLSASDYLDLRFTSDGSGDVVEIEIINFNISQVN